MLCTDSDSDHHHLSRTWLGLRSNLASLTRYYLDVSARTGDTLLRLQDHASHISHGTNGEVQRQTIRRMIPNTYFWGWLSYTLALHLPAECQQRSVRPRLQLLLYTSTPVYACREGSLGQSLSSDWALKVLRLARGEVSSRYPLLRALLQVLRSLGEESSTKTIK